MYGERQRTSVFVHFLSAKTRQRRWNFIEKENVKKKYNLSNKPLRVSLLQLRVHGRVMDAEQQKMWF